MFRNKRCGAAWLLLAVVVATPVGGAEQPAIAFDGVGVHPRDPHAGASGARLLRMTPSAYGDGRSSPAGVGRANPRMLSNALASEAGVVANARGASDLFWLWGQFVDHDLDLTTAAVPAEAFDIRVPTGDPWFDPGSGGTTWIRMERSAWDRDSGTSSTNPRQQINAITAFLDGSNVYGSDPGRAAALRAFDGSGRLRTSRGDLLPFNESGLDNAGGPSPALYLAGDVRANENVALTAMHTLWMREHNRLAGALQRTNPAWSGDVVFAEARRHVVAQLQVITYQEFLPLLLGARALPRYGGFDPRVDPGICQEFSVAAYRFGHSMVPDLLHRLGADGRPAGAGHLPLGQAFFAPWELTPELGIEPYLRGLAGKTAREIDPGIADSLRNFLFGSPGAGGLDLAARNIQRGRDHGLMDYNGVREALGLAPAASFVEMTGDPRLAEQLGRLYGTPDDADLWVGGLAEDHFPGAMVGPTFHAVLVDQFARLRDGDPHFYRREFSGGQLRRLERTTLTKVIRRNTSIRGELQKKALLAPR